MPNGNGLSRRSFVKRSLAGAAVLGAVAAVPGWLLGRSGGEELPAATNQSDGLGEPVVAYVRDAERGEVVLLRGTREVVRQDRALASHLISCCQEV